MISDTELIEKLYSKSGPILKWRIATELMGLTPEKLVDLHSLVENHSAVQKLIKLYSIGANYDENYPYSKLIHGAKPELLENVSGKLWAYGIRKGFPCIDQYYKSYLKILEQDYYNENAVRIGYGKYFIAQMLGLLGYADEEPIKSILQTRLDEVFHFIKLKKYDIYVDACKYPKLPSNWMHINKIIDPTLTNLTNEQDNYPLPYQYDILGFVGMAQVGLTDDNQDKINAILRYCYDDNYQYGILYKYGIALYTNGYYSMGWSIHLPGYGQELTSDLEINKLLLWADIFSNFQASRGFPLFYNLLDFLENYRKPDGYYSFLKKFIPESKQGYFINGKYMNLGEDKLHKEAALIESTFRVLKLKKNLGLINN